MIFKLGIINKVEICVAGLLMTFCINLGEVTLYLFLLFAWGHFLWKPRLFFINPM